jgi:pimeloyl-ACP methyl ester carboxylesterase
MQRRTTSFDGLDLAFDDVGSGEPTLVLVHGWSCDRSYWREQLESLSARHRMVAIDLASHGDSAIRQAPPTMEAFGRDVVAVVETLGLKRTVLVGHSMGGDVIVHAGALLGDRVAGHVWVDTYSSLSGDDISAETARFVEPFRADFPARTRELIRGFFPPNADPAIVTWVVEDMASAPPDIAVPELLAARTAEPGVIALLPRLRGPLVALNPDDHETDVANLRSFGIETVFVTGTGHFPMLEDPSGLAELLVRLLVQAA